MYSKKTFLVFVMIFGVIVSLGCTESNADTVKSTNKETSVEEGSQTKATNEETTVEETSKIETEKETNSEETTSVEETSTEINYHIIANWTGSCTKDTETFHVSSNEWKVAWDTKPGKNGESNFILTIYNSDGTYKSSAANVIGSSSDYSIIRGSGDYYLSILSGQPYEIAVESSGSETPEEGLTEANYQVVTSFEGDSTKDTETFHVPSDIWKISWNTKPGKIGEANFILTVYNSDGTYKSSAANVIGSSSDYSIIRGSGDYYLSILSSQPYKINVESQL